MFNIKTFYDRGASYSSESPKTPEMERVFIRDMFLSTSSFSISNVATRLFPSYFFST